MLGVVRIYSRKVQYLFDDCKEARERIVMVSNLWLRGISLLSDNAVIHRPSDRERWTCPKTSFGRARQQSPFRTRATTLICS